MFVFTDPFFWAFAGMCGLLAGIALVSGIKPGRNAVFGFITILICDSSRIVLVLPFCTQPRFDIGVWNWIVGGIILAAAMVFAFPALSINWRTAPESKMTLKTDGIYGVVRNPIYLAETLLERALGKPYLDYKQMVKGRIIPGLPV